MCQELENALGSGAVQKALFSPHGAHYLSASAIGNIAGQRSSSAQRPAQPQPPSTWPSSDWPQTEATLLLPDDMGDLYSLNCEAFFGEEHSLRDDPPSTEVLIRTGMEVELSQRELCAELEKSAGGVDIGDVGAGKEAAEEVQMGGMGGMEFVERAIGTISQTYST
jgi:hypothetical protein